MSRILRPRSRHARRPRSSRRRSSSMTRPQVLSVIVGECARSPAIPKIDASPSPHEARRTRAQVVRHQPLGAECLCRGAERAPAPVLPIDGPARGGIHAAGKSSSSSLAGQAQVRKFGSQRRTQWHGARRPLDLLTRGSSHYSRSLQLGCSVRHSPDQGTPLPHPCLLALSAQAWPRAPVADGLSKSRLPYVSMHRRTSVERQEPRYPLLRYRRSSRMSSPALPNITQAADELVAALADVGPRSDAVLWLRGRLSAGKSSCLAEVATRLVEREPDAVPVLLTPPQRQLDTGPVALIDFGAEVSALGASRESFMSWASSRRPWRERLGDAKRWLEEHEDRLVLLCDDPTFWSGGLSEETGFFSGRASDVSRLLVEQARCRRVIAGRIPESVSADRIVTLIPDAPAREWLLETDAWGELAPAARALEETGAPLEGLTALELRLAVGLAAISDARETATVLLDDRHRSKVGSTLWRHVASEQGLARLKRAWLRLSFVRRRFSADLLDELRVKELSKRDAAIVRNCLLFGEDDNLRLHEVVRTQARSWLSDQPPSRRRGVERNAAE